MRGADFRAGACSGCLDCVRTVNACDSSVAGDVYAGHVTIAVAFTSADVTFTGRPLA